MNDTELLTENTYLDLAKKTRYTGYICAAFASIPANSQCRITADPAQSVIQISSGKLCETIPYSKLKSFTAYSDVSTSERGLGFGGAIVKSIENERGSSIIGQSVTMKKKKIKWMADLVIATEDGEDLTLTFAEKAGFGYNTSTVKSYETRHLEEICKYITANF